MTTLDAIRDANGRYAETFTKGSLPTPPARRFAVVTCMDARLDPAKFLGLDEGDAHVIRNAGGLVNADAIRSLVISHHLLGTQEALVVGHTECGMLTFTNDDLHARLGPESHGVDFEPFSNLEERVRDSVAAIESSPLLPESFRATGFVYDVRNGRLVEVT